MSAAVALEPGRFERGEAHPARLVANVVQLLEIAHAEFERDQETAKASLSHAAVLLRLELKRHEPPVKPQSVSGELAVWQVQRLKAHIESHLGETIRIKDLSAIARRSTGHFCRAFKRTFGQTPHAYVTARRLTKAKSLMIDSREQLSSIAVACGFTDQAHLSKLFRQHLGETPRAWRRRNLLDEENGCSETAWDALP